MRNSLNSYPGPCSEPYAEVFPVGWYPAMPKGRTGAERLISTCPRESCVGRCMAWILQTAFQTLWDEKGFIQTEEAQNRSCLIQILRPWGKLRSFRPHELGPFQGVCSICLPCHVGTVLWAQRTPLIYPDPFKPAPPRAWQFTPHLTVCQGTTGQSRASTRVIACNGGSWTIIWSWWDSSARKSSDL